MKKSFNQVFNKPCLVGVLMIGILCFSACKKETTDEHTATHIYNYHNQSTHTIRIEKYTSTLDGDWNILPNSMLVMEAHYPMGKIESIYQYDSLRIVFDGTKELWFTNIRLDDPYNPYGNNYLKTELGNKITQYDYIFNEEQYGLATNIQ